MVLRGNMFFNSFKLNGETAKRQKIKHIEYAPPRCAGFAMVFYDHNAVVSGSVEDSGGTDKDMISYFHNDMFASNLNEKKVPYDAPEEE